MEVFHKLEEAAGKVGATSVAIGNFDGVHKGHVALLSHMMEYARNVGATPTVLTFFPHPVEVLKPSVKLQRLTTTSEKLTLLEKLGVELVLVQTFDADLAALPASDFFEHFLLRGLKAKSIHVGFDFTFGKGRSGNTEVLEQLAKEHRIVLQVESPQQIGAAKISSSAIREMIGRGEVAKAAEWLGRPYFLSGEVVAGQHRGRTIGFPTANLHYAPEKVLPKHGVYATRAIWQQQTFLSVTNVGVRPTFNGGAPTAEVHLLDFDARLYDEFLRVEFLERLRDEQKFDSVDSLKAQIVSDVARVRAMMGAKKEE